jgi:hypothetical protein
VIKHLLEKDADPNARNKNGDLPIHHAETVERLERLLAAQDADIDVPNGNGETCLQWICVKESYPLVVRLLWLEADPNLQDHAGNTPAHFAHTMYILTKLLWRRIDPHVKNHAGKTALHKVVEPRGPNLDLLQAMIEYGYDVAAKDNKEKIPISLASFREVIFMSDLVKSKTGAQKQTVTVTASQERETNKPFSEDDYDFSGNSICPIRERWFWKECQRWMIRYTTALSNLKPQGRRYIHIPEHCASTRNLKRAYEKRFPAKRKGAAAILFTGFVLGEDLAFMSPCLEECHGKVFEWPNICFASMSFIERFDRESYGHLVEYVEEKLDEARGVVRGFIRRKSPSVEDQYIVQEFSKHQTNLQKFQLGLKDSNSGIGKTILSEVQQPFPPILPY